MAEISIAVNGNRHRVQVDPHELLADVLRTKLGYIEVKNGCGNGECGSCTVLLEGKVVASCITLALRADGKNIITAAGLAENGQLHMLQRKFVEHEAIQCGYCTPGMLISAKALLDSNPNPTEEQVRLAISGNICRCTGYQQIVEAIMAAAQELRLLHDEPGAKNE
jgi:carbon-monoxide dehydrogenase small subunit